MSNNFFENKRKQIYSDYEDMLFRLAMMKYAEKQGQELTLREEELNREGQVGPSVKEKQKYDKVLRRALFRGRIKSVSRVVSKALGKVAVVFLIVSMLFGTLLVTVEAVRIKTLNFLINIQEGFTEVKPDSQSTSSQSNGISLANTYSPDYIPTGFVISALNNGSDSLFCVFGNESGNTIYFHVYMGSSGTNVDTEDATLEQITIQGEEGMLIKKGNMTTIVWDIADVVFVVGADISEEETMRVAESVTYKK
jgi:hypothetical protein